MNGGQCSAEHTYHGEVHYCVLNEGHGLRPHECYYGHTWRGHHPAPTQDRGTGEEGQ
jgi:hypothetical protein